MTNLLKSLAALVLFTIGTFSSGPLLAKDFQAGLPLHYGYHRLLPLEGGSNFRDLGGYKTKDGKTVVRGQLFRSGAMSGLTEADMEYLDQFHFKTVVDMRSRDEIQLIPNHWAKTHNIAYVSYDYGFSNIAAGASIKSGTAPGEEFSMGNLYKNFPVILKPQLSLYFQQLLDHGTPLVVNCSAGQDRTGTASALLLIALGVPRETVVEDYLLSTDYRNPANEMKGIVLDSAGDDNGFAKMMLRYKKEGGRAARPEILKSADGTAYIDYLFAALDAEYGSVENYLDKELDVDAQGIARLRSLYLN